MCILKMKKWRFREVKTIVQCHKARQGRSQDSTLLYLAPEPILLAQSPHTLVRVPVHVNCWGIWLKYKF